MAFCDPRPNGVVAVEEASTRALPGASNARPRCTGPCAQRRASNRTPQLTDTLHFSRTFLSCCVFHQLSGTAERPRISVYRSNQHTYVQVIDDDNQTTLAALGTMSSAVKDVVGTEEWKSKTVAAAEEVGKQLGKMCIEKGIKSAVFDRGGYIYHGRVKAVAEACREAGMEF